MEERRKAILKIEKQSNSHLTQTSEGDEYKDMRNRSYETSVTWTLKSHWKAASGCNTFDFFFTSLYCTQELLFKVMCILSN